MSQKNWVSKAGLTLAVSKIKELINKKVDKDTFASESQSGLMTSAEHIKLKGLKKIEKVSELTNDKGYITSADVPPGSVASVITPKMDAPTAVIGTDNGFSRGDHQHPTDTSRASQSELDSVKASLHSVAADMDNKLNKTDIGDWAKAPTKPTYTWTEVGAEKAGTSAATLTQAKAYADQKVSALGTVYKVKGSKNNYSELPSDAQNGDVYNVKNKYNNYPAGTNFVKTDEGWDAFGGEIDLTGYTQDSDFVEVTTQEILEMFN